MLRLFEHVYVTKESLDNDLRGNDRFGWYSPLIFCELAEKEWDNLLKPIDWRGPDLHDDVRASVEQVHREILHEITPANVRSWIEQKSLFPLDQFKLRLLQPITDALGCVPYFSPNALKHWRPTTDSLADPQTLSSQIVSQIAEPISLGTILCRHPREASPRGFEEQARIEQTIGRALIADHVAGGRSFGLNDPDEYLDKLGPLKAASDEGNKSMEDDWKKNRFKLRELRHLAHDTGLWNKLHNEWLPHLHDETVPRKNKQDFVQKFPATIKSALSPKIVERLDLESRCAWFIGPAAVLSVIVAALSAGLLSAENAMGIAYFLGRPISDKLRELAESDIANRQREIGSLAAFYQEARRIR